MAIGRTAMVDDDGSGTTGTVVNNAWKQEFYDQIDAALAGTTISSGNWTPSLQGSSGGSATYTAQQGFYVKSGRNVTGWYLIQVNSKGTLAGDISVAGIPFSYSSPVGFFAGGNVQWIGLATTWVTIFPVFSTATVFALQGATAAGASANTTVKATDLANGCYFVGMIIYPTTS